MKNNQSTSAPVADGHRLKTLRLDRRMRVVEVAEATGISAAHIYRLEASDRPNVAAVTLAGIASALETSLEYLLCMTDDPRSIDELTAHEGSGQ